LSLVSILFLYFSYSYLLSLSISFSSYPTGGSENPAQGVDVWCVYAFILCLCCPMFR
jgi:hypothetical protein